MGVVSKDLHPNQDMCALIPNSSVSTRFLCYLIQGCEQHLLRLWCKDGSTVESVEHDLMASTWIALPDIDEQQEIVNHLDTQGDSIASLDETYAHQLTLLSEYRAALIHECVTGQREVSDLQQPIGETAHVL